MKSNYNNAYAIEDIKNAMVIWYAYNLPCPPTIETIEQNADYISFTIHINKFFKKDGGFE